MLVLKYSNSEKKKEIGKLFYWVQFAQEKGQYIRVRSIMRNKFLAATTKADHQLSENFYFIKNIIWLTYESFSILSDAFRQKSVIFSKNSCSWVIWFYITHTHTHTLKTHTTHTHRCTAHSGASRLTHQYKSMFMPLFLCAHQSSSLYIDWINNSLISIIYFQQNDFSFQNYLLVKVIYIGWLDAIRLIGGHTWKQAF